MGRLRFCLTSLIFWALLIISIYFVENVPLFIKGMSSFDPLCFGLITFIITLLLFIFYISEHKTNKMKVDFILLPIILIFLVFGLIAIWNNKSSQIFERYVTALKPFGPVEISVTNELKMRATVQFILVIAITYGLLFAYGRRLFKLKYVKWFISIYILYCLASIIFSFFLNVEEYKNMLTLGKTATSGIKSFYINENIFGFGLFIGLISCAINNLIKRRWWNYVLFLVFYLFTFLSSSVTSIAAGTALFILYFLLEFIVNLKKHPVKSLLFATLMIILGVVSIILIIEGTNHELGFISNIAKFINDDILRKNLETFTGRTEIWEQANYMVSNNGPLTLMFGRGYYISNYLVKIITAKPGEVGSSTAHSVFAHLFLTYGIFGLILYISFLVYYLYALIRIAINKEYTYAFTFFFCFLAMIIHNCFETNYFLSFNTSGITVTMILLIPPLVKFKSIKHNAIENEIMNREVKTKQLNPNSMFRLTSYVFGLIIFICLSCLVLPYTFHSKTLVTIIVIALAISAISIPLLPRLLTFMYHKVGYIRFFIRVISYFAIQGGFAYFLYFCFYKEASNPALAFIFIPIAYIFLSVIFIFIYKYASGIENIDGINNIFCGTLIIPSLSPLITFLLGTLPILFISTRVDFHSIDFIICIIYECVVYITFSSILPFKNNKRLLYEINTIRLNRLTLCGKGAIKNERKH